MEGKFHRRAGKLQNARLVVSSLLAEKNLRGIKLEQWISMTYLSGPSFLDMLPQSVRAKYAVPILVVCSKVQQCFCFDACVLMCEDVTKYNWDLQVFPLNGVKRIGSNFATILFALLCLPWLLCFSL